MEAEEVLVFPASLTQQRFWLLDQISPGNPAYNVPVRFRLTGELDPAVMERAVNAMIARHEVLRTQFAVEDGTPVQHILLEARIGVPVTDLRHLSEEERKAAVEDAGTREAHTPFDLTKAPLIRANLLRTSDREHILQVNIHHAVCDGWSVGVVTDDLAALYAAELEGRVPKLAELPIQYGDFSVWQRDWLIGDSVSSQLAYWKEQLLDLPEFKVMPDHPRPVKKSFNGDIASIVLRRELTGALQQLVQAEGCTLSMAFLTAYFAMLHRHTGATDLRVGTPIAGRTRAELEPLIGVFINTLVLRVDASGDPAMRKLLGRVRTMMVDAMAHQDVPFERVVQEVAPERDPGRNPLFDIGFVHQRDFVKPVTFCGIELEAIPSRSPGALFDLNFFAVERADGWRLSFDYNTDLFERGTVDRMLSHVQWLLEAMVANPAVALSRAPLMNDAERRQVLVDFNDTAAEYPRDATLYELFAEQVLARPDAPAVRWGWKTLNYRELNEKACAVAHFLAEIGIAPGSYVGICAGQTVENVVGTLGIIRAGCAYVPLDPAFPRERVAFIARDTGMAAVLTLAEHRLLFEGVQARVHTLDAGWRQIRKAKPSPMPEGTGPESAVYVMFTSGSTGEPKGVVAPHRAIVRLVRNQSYVTLSPGDVVASLSNVAFDASTFELWGALLNGALLHGVAREVAIEPVKLRAEIDRAGITTMFLTTALFNQIAAVIPGAYSKLKHMLFGGEAADAAAVRRVLRAGGPAQLMNIYGPTEATTFAVAFPVREVPENAVGLPIGRPLANTRAFVLDEKLEPLPVGVVGELCIGGDALALGYLNRPELTREKFVMRDGERIYRTGDRARWRTDGTLECLGRLDAQVKIRGFRIEPGEIEAALRAHPLVGQAAVLVRETAGIGKQLVAYFSPRAGAKPDWLGLRDFLRERLPEYMVPSMHVMLDKLPVTANGKLDVRALPEPGGCADVELERAALPLTPTERALAEIWARLLKRGNIGRHDDFFDLGGHSLLAAHLFADIERAKLAKGIPLATLFSAPTVARLAAVIDRERDREVPVGASLVALRPEGTEVPFFCIHGGDGGLLFYRDLAKRLPPNQPFYGVEAPWIHGVAPEYSSIEEIAAAYIEEVETRQKPGPYLLGGFSFGGVVAFEMARQLAERGEAVPLLVLFDTFNPARRPRRLTFAERMARISHDAAQKSWLAGAGFVIERAWGKVLANAWKFEEQFRRSLVRALPAMRRLTELRFVEARDIHAELLRNYRPQKFPGTLTLFCAETPEEGWEYPENLGWNELADRVDVIPTPGGHGRILKAPHVDALAVKVRELLAKNRPTEKLPVAV